jgi:hypothetical protein
MAFGNSMVRRNLREMEHRVIVLADCATSKTAHQRDLPKKPC